MPALGLLLGLSAIWLVDIGIPNCLSAAFRFTETVACKKQIQLPVRFVSGSKK